MSAINLAAQGNAAGNYGQTGGLGSYLFTSASNFLGSGLNGGGWNIANAFGDPTPNASGKIFNANWGSKNADGIRSGSLTGYDAGLGAVAGAVGGLLDKSAAHLRTSGKYGHVAQTVDTVANVVGSVGNFNPLATGLGRLGMGAINNITGGTDGMTAQDSLLGSSAVSGTLAGLAAVSATNPIGWAALGTYALASGINAATGKTTTDNAYKSFMDKDKLTDVTSGYTDMDLENEAQNLYNKKYGGFSRGAYKKALKKIDEAQMRMTDKIDIRDTAKLGQIRAGMVDANNMRYQMSINGGYKPLAIGKQGLKITPERLKEAKEIAKRIRKKRSAKFNIIQEEAREAIKDVTKMPSDVMPAFKIGGNIELFQNGGDMNVIPEGALHARKHHMEDDEHITKKGIPVVDINGTQQAEIERNEIIFRKEVTNELEKLFKDGSDEAAIEAGKLLAKEIIENTDDRTGLIQEVTGEPKLNHEVIPSAKLGATLEGLFKSGKENQDKLSLENLKNSLKISEAFAELNQNIMNNGPAEVATTENGYVVTTKPLPKVDKPEISNTTDKSLENLLAEYIKTNQLKTDNGPTSNSISNLVALVQNALDLFLTKKKADETEDGDDPTEIPSTATPTLIGKDYALNAEKGEKLPNPSLKEFIESKILERTKAAIEKAITRKTPYMFKNKNWKNCIATLSDNYGVPVILRNVDLATDPNKYGFEEIYFGDNTDTLPDGVIIQDYNKENDSTVPGHSIMLVGRDENGAPIYSWSLGDSDAKSMINLSKNYRFRRWNEDGVKPRAYRYIGTPSERKAWEEEYNILYPKFENGGIIEELNKLSPEKMEGLKNILKYLNND